jgi:insulysin
MINIIKPQFDKRKFIGGKLSNNIKYAFIHDDSLEKSFISVAINVGSYSNPKGYDGLAHFLEHMLFMGSKKYPQENHYNERLNKLGGSSNAYTDTFETVYYLNVFNDGLSEIIDIFAQFFIDPLFASDSVSREINAVDSEHQKNINSDSWRRHQFILDLADKTSPVNTFICGSKQTLDQPDIRNQLIAFYNKYYTSDNISICIASSIDPRELYEIVNCTFGVIESKRCEKIIISKPIYSKNTTKTYHLKSLSTKYDVVYMHEIPKQNIFLLKEFNIFDLILTDKSEKSLNFHLKNIGYLKSIHCEIKHEGLFVITLSLTKEGFDNRAYCEYILFETIKQILQMDIKQIVEYFTQVLNISFNCLNKFHSEDLCNVLSVNHFYYNTQNIFIGNFKIFEIKSTQYYRELFTEHINLQNFIRFFHTKKYSYNADIQYLKDPNYNFEYIELSFNNLVIPLYYNQPLCYQIELNTSNDYLSMHPAFINGLDIFKVPRLIDQRQWYGACSEFGEPLVSIWLQLNNYDYFTTPKKYILTNISCSILNFLINFIMYQPLQLCYSISFEPSNTLSSININIDAPNDCIKLQSLIRQLCDFIFNIDKHFKKLNQTYTNNLIISYREMFENTKYLNPTDFSSYLVKSMIIDTEYSYTELLEEINNITYDDIKYHISHLLDCTSVTSLTYGNIEVSNLINLFTPFTKHFYNFPYVLPNIRAISDIEISHPNPKEKSHCINYYFYVGKFLPISYATILLLSKILSESFFSSLRTQQQLGYIVKFFISIYRDEYYICEKVQSSYSPSFVCEKIDEFNTSINKFIDESDLEKFKEITKQDLEEKDYSLEEKINRYKPEIALRTYLFNRNILVRDQVDKITKTSIRAFVNKLFQHSNRKVVIIKGSE